MLISVFIALSLLVREMLVGELAVLLFMGIDGLVGTCNEDAG